jgi:hypothetical protein
VNYDIDRLDKFRAVFKVALRQVLTLYKTARIDLHEDRGRRSRSYSQGGKPVYREEPAKGLTLYNSPPPVPGRILISGKP